MNEFVADGSENKVGDYSPLWYADRETFAQAEVDGFTEAVFGRGSWYNASAVDQVRTVAFWGLFHPDSRILGLDHPKYRKITGPSVHMGVALEHFDTQEQFEAYIADRHITLSPDRLDLRDVNSTYHLGDWGVHKRPQSDLEVENQSSTGTAVRIKNILSRLRNRL